MALSGTFCYFIELFHLLTLFPLCFNTFKHFFAPSGTFFTHFLANGWIFKLFFYTLLSLDFSFLFGTVWHFSEHFGSFWHAIKIQKRPEIKNMAHLIFIFIFVGPIWTILDQFGAKFHPFRPLWTHFFTTLELLGNIWSSFKLFGAFWSYLETFEAVWSQV